MDKKNFKLTSRVITVDIALKKVRDNAIIPFYAHGHEDSGLDLFTAAVKYKKDGQWIEHEGEVYSIQPLETVLVETGVATAIPEGTELQVRPTSGNSLSTMLRIANSPGTIDSGYRNEIGVIVTNLGDKPINISLNDKIAQMVLMPVLHANIILVDELNKSKRDKHGYGSTGKIKAAK